MADLPVTMLNRKPLNLAALAQLRRARERADATSLHLLTLAQWGLEQGAAGEWPNRDRPAIEAQIGLLLGWSPQTVISWLTSNPNGPDRNEQEQSLTQDLEAAATPQAAASLLLSAIYSRQQAENPALQPAASASN